MKQSRKAKNNKNYKNKNISKSSTKKTTIHVKKSSLTNKIVAPKIKII